MRLASLALSVLLVAACGWDESGEVREPAEPGANTGSDSPGGNDDTPGDDNDGNDDEPGDDDGGEPPTTGGDSDPGDGEGGDDDGGDDDGGDDDGGDDDGGDDDGGDGGDDDDDGCALGPAPTGVLQKRIGNSAGQRSYLLVVPDGYSPAAYPEGMSLVFGFHGLGSNAAEFRSYSRVETPAGGQAIFVYPQGLSVEEDDPSRTGWDLSPTGRDIELFDDILAEVSAEYCVNPARVFAMGHSFGGFFSNEVACARGDAIAAIASVAGGGPFAASCNGGPVRAWITHGRSDTVVPFSRGEASRDYWASANECPRVATRAVEPPPCGASVECGDAVVWCPHQERAYNGHGWPRYTPAAIWAFFSR